VIFRQVTHDDLGCASYLIGDEDAGIAAVIDPKLEIDEYLRLARYFGVRIEHILETHNHADHVSGHGHLAAATDATIHIHQDAGVNYPHESFTDGWELNLGSVTVRALHTPSHRSEHTVFALIDTARGPEPWAVLSGDTLFVGDIARPDLAVDKQEGARGMFRSLRDTLLELPDHCEVWPGHLGGSLCGGPGMDMKVASTIGYERRHQELLACLFMDRIGHRRLQLIGFPAMGAMFLLIALIPGVTSAAAPFLLLFGASYFFAEFGPNTTTFVMAAECYPTSVRATGHGLSAGIAKLGAFFGVYLFPEISNAFGLAGALKFAAGMALLGTLLTLVLPEPSRRSLEDISDEALRSGEPQPLVHGEVQPEVA
jgi:glyoxylase-like metal-dependent hydrolase (beta-lactamase superfamily II)